MRQSFFGKRRLQVVLGAVAVAMLLAAVMGEVAVASNMAFKLNKAVLSVGPINGSRNLVAFPFRTPVLNARNICQVFGTVSAQVTIQLLDGAGGLFNHTCNLAGDGFALNAGGAPGLTAGVGVRIINDTGAPLSGIIVGSHIPGGGPAGNYTQNDSGAGNIGRKWYAVPYHTTNAFAGDICVDAPFTAGTLLQRVNTAGSLVFSYICVGGAADAGAGFALVLGEAVEIRDEDTGPIAFAPEHF